MTRDNYLEDGDESRRSFMKKGALASSVAALGLASGGTAATNTNVQETPGTGLVFIDNYDPGVPFTVVTQMEQSTVNDVFAARQDDTTIIDPSNYNGYIVHEQYDEETHGDFWFVFTQQATLETDQTYTFSEQVVFFSSELSLIKAEIRTVETGRAPEDGETTEETTTEETPTEETTTEETTTEETTTEEITAEETTTEEDEEVAVNATETTAEGATGEGNATAGGEETEEVVVNATETTTTEEQ